jgi:peptidoglycan/LPS O-acetylase OafA/YrhL
MLQIQNSMPSNSLNWWPGTSTGLPRYMNNAKYSGLQVGRGIAALAVVIFHAKMILIRFPDDYFLFPFLGKFGFYGVHFFFVISGFIIFHVISNPQFRPLPFALKRFFRLWPLYFVATLTYCAIYLIQRNLPPGELGYTFPALLKALAFWPQAKYPLLNTGWSLEHEVIYYIYAAVVCGLAGRRVFFVFLAANALAGQLLLNILPLYGVRLINWDYHLISSLNTYFFIGASVFMMRERLARFGVVAPLVVGLLMIVLGAYACSLIDVQQLKKALEIPSVGVGAGLVLLGLLNFDSAEGRVARVRSTYGYRSLHWLGDRSYSLYLFHFLWIPIFQTIHRDYVKWPDYLAEPLCMTFVGVSIVTAAIAYRLIEIPSNQYGAELAKRVSMRPLVIGPEVIPQSA